MNGYKRILLLVLIMTAVAMITTGATISQIREAHSNYQGFGETGEFTLARREGDKIVFLLRHRRHEVDEQKPVPFDSSLAEPMRRALPADTRLLARRRAAADRCFYRRRARPPRLRRQRLPGLGSRAQGLFEARHPYVVDRR